jgi:hypothetical protein
VMRFLIDVNLSPARVGLFASHNIEATHWTSIGDPPAPDDGALEQTRQVAGCQGPPRHAEHPHSMPSDFDFRKHVQQLVAEFPAARHEKHLSLLRELPYRVLKRDEPANA